MLSSRLSKVDPKLVAAVTLILGLIVGYYIDNSLISGPKIIDLTNQTVAQQESINEFKKQLGSLENEKKSLQTQYEEMETSTQQTIEEQSTQIVSLENQIQSGLDLIDELQVDIEELEGMFDEVWNDYSDLQDMYDEAYNPLITEFTIDELDIKFTINSDVYSDNTPIQGLVEISYSDGTDFRGTYKLHLYKIFISAGSLSEASEIRGTTAYNWNNPFVLGPGSYRLSLSDIKDNQGELVVSNSNLREYPLYVFLG